MKFPMILLSLICQSALALPAANLSTLEGPIVGHRVEGAVHINVFKGIPDATLPRI